MVKGEMFELTEKEKTALTLLLGLRQKFAKEKKEGISYTANELHKLFSELFDKVNKEELKFVDAVRFREDQEVKTSNDEVWGVIDEAIARSTIKRYNWNKVFGKSLTEEILRLKKDGYNVNETFIILKDDQRIRDFLHQHPNEMVKILENLKISVHARYGENNTANKIMEGMG